MTYDIDVTSDSGKIQRRDNIRTMHRNFKAASIVPLKEDDYAYELSAIYPSVPNSIHSPGCAEVAIEGKLKLLLVDDHTTYENGGWIAGHVETWEAQFTVMERGGQGRETSFSRVFQNPLEAFEIMCQTDPRVFFLIGDMTPRSSKFMHEDALTEQTVQRKKQKIEAAKKAKTKPSPPPAPPGGRTKIG